MSSSGGSAAAFLNATLLGKRQHGKDEKAKEVKPTTPPERHIAAVELPAGLPQSTLRDALLQARVNRERAALRLQRQRDEAAEAEEARFVAAAARLLRQ